MSHPKRVRKRSGLKSALLSANCASALVGWRRVAMNARRMGRRSKGTVLGANAVVGEVAEGVAEHNP